MQLYFATANEMAIAVPNIITTTTAKFRMFVETNNKSTLLKVEEWCLLGCYAVWLL
jgi:hypothetical protein